MTNILILSAGRRVELLQAFQDAANKNGQNTKVFAADLRPDRSSACQIAERAFKLAAVRDTAYAGELADLCAAEEISIVIPTIDTELGKLAELAPKFSERGTEIIVSNRRIIELCSDKRKTGQLFSDIGIPTPAIYQSPEEIVFPCFTKPFDGSSSEGAFLLRSASELTSELLADPRRMFMELIPPDYREITVDLYYDRSGDLKAMVPRERLETRGGEVSKGVTRRDWVYDKLISRLNRLEGARGCITLQLFASREAEIMQAIEINPRFGGGYPLSCAAGADFPQWIIDEYILGKKVAFCDDWEANLLMLRYDAKTLTHGYKGD